MTQIYTLFIIETRRLKKRLFRFEIEFKILCLYSLTFMYNSLHVQYCWAILVTFTQSSCVSRSRSNPEKTINKHSYCRNRVVDKTKCKV